MPDLSNVPVGIKCIRLHFGNNALPLAARINFMERLIKQRPRRVVVPISIEYRLVFFNITAILVAQAPTRLHVTFIYATPLHRAFSRRPSPRATIDATPACAKATLLPVAIIIVEGLLRAVACLRYAFSVLAPFVVSAGRLPGIEL